MLVIAGTKMESQKKESNYVNYNFGEAFRIFNLHTVSGSTLSSCLVRWKPYCSLIGRLVQYLFLLCVSAWKSRSGWVGSWQPFIALIAVIHKTLQCCGRSLEPSPEVVAECLICINLPWCLSDEGMFTCSLKAGKSPCLINPRVIKVFVKSKRLKPLNS